MSEFTNRLFSSDLDAFRSDGVVYTDSMTFSGTIAGSDSQIQTSTGIEIPNLDFNQLLFDNSTHHSDKWRDVSLEGKTLVLETTTSTQLATILTVKIIGGLLQVVGEVFNAYSTPVDIESTTINVRLVAYDTTLL